MRTVAATFLLFGSMFAVGGTVLLLPRVALPAFICAAIGGSALAWLRRYVRLEDGGPASVA